MDRALSLVFMLLAIGVWGWGYASLRAGVFPGVWAWAAILVLGAVVFAWLSRRTRDPRRSGVAVVTLMFVIPLAVLWTIPVVTAHVALGQRAFWPDAVWLGVWTLVCSAVTFTAACGGVGGKSGRGVVAGEGVRP